ncbi:MAG: hypothetical protein RR585_15825, partial [Coprobacillus sp.]
SSLLLMTLIFFHLDAPLVSMVALVSYGGVHIMLCMTLFFKLGMAFMNRTYRFHQLRCLGFVEEDLKKIVKLEMFTFFGIVLWIPLIYQVTMLGKLLYTQSIQISLSFMIIGLEVLPLCIAFLLSYGIYRKSVLLRGRRKNEGEDC